MSTDVFGRIYFESRNGRGGYVSADRFALRLKELREQAGLTQDQLASKCKLTKAGIAQLEQGRRKPAWETVLTIAGALKVECTAFTQEPAAHKPQGRGRPRKYAADAPPAEPKRPRGRPRKGKQS